MSKNHFVILLSTFCQLTLGWACLAAGLYNSMIAPFRKMDFTTVLWVQGEANAHTVPNATSTSPIPPPQEYECAFAAMIEGWRTLFEHQDLPVVFEQIRPYCNGVTWCGITPTKLTERELALPLLRNAQLGVYKSMWNSTAMVVTADLGDTVFPRGPAGQIHSRLKGPVTDRMSAAVLGLVYNRSVAFRSPRPLGASVVNHSASTTTIHVNVADTGEKGLAPLKAASCPTAKVNASSPATVPYPEVFCSDNVGFEAFVPSSGPGGGSWVPARVISVQSDALMIEAAAGQVTQLRYGFIDWPVMTVFSGDQLPLTPFVATVEP